MAKSNFSKSLGRELGKNTGKLISNKLFGNGHATPYRISGKVQVAQIRANTANAQAEAMRAQANAELKAEEMRYEQENLAIEMSAIGEISNIELSQNPKVLANQLNQIVSLMNGQRSRNIIKAGIEKIDFGILNLRSNDPAQAAYFDKKLKNLKFKYNIPYYSLAGAAVLLGLGALFMNLKRRGGIHNMGMGLLVVGMFALLFTITKFFNKK